ncbi:MAG: hypothetical protein GY777_04555 [Candidatus Brocadiaceae bacterium]|nr:hypothetical protein [Candidatus Brocadiaceae bacterium]
MKFATDTITPIEELEDGSTIYEVGEPELEQNSDNSFYANLAEDLTESSRHKLSTYLLESIDEDIEARKDWLTSVQKVKEYLGFSLEDLQGAQFTQATRTFDTTLSTALIRFYATTRAELLPQSGPAGFKIQGEQNEALEKQGELICNWLNYFLTIKDNSYYSDFERFLLYLGLYGSGFKKVYYDKISEQPISRFIMPEDFVIDGDCTSVLESERLTHILHLSKRDILLKQQSGIYRECELPYLKGINSNDQEDDEEDKKKDGINLGVYTKQSLFPIYEVHTYLNLEDFINDGVDENNEEVPLPYVVTIDKISKEILAIRRNWEEQDADKKRTNYFVQYNYLPGFGVYGIGLAHLLGSNAITLTSLLRQLVDAGSFKNLPGGLRVKGFKQQNNDLMVGPGEFVEVDTGGVPLQEAFMPLPYSEPSQTLRELRLEIVNQCKELGSTSELGMLDSKEDIPTGTMLAALENNNRIQSAVLRSIHHSLSYELQLIEKLFKDTLTYQEFSFNETNASISGEDFVEEVKIIPIADPSTNSRIQKIIKAQEVLRTAEQSPDLHNMREVLRINYEAQGLSAEEIDKILPSEESEEILPLDPITENINILSGKGVSAAMWQDHAAHKMVHGTFAQQHPELQAEIMAHITEHEAYEYLIQMQQTIGSELPPLEEIQNPEIQNAIALAAAKGLEETGQASQEENAPIDPNQLILADIQQKEEEVKAKERMSDKKLEFDTFKTQLDFEKEKAKIESNEDIAKLKAETELEKSSNK